MGILSLFNVSFGADRFYSLAQPLPQQKENRFTTYGRTIPLLLVLTYSWSSQDRSMTDLGENGVIEFGKYINTVLLFPDSVLP
jgi:hypothetical protein